MVFRRKIYKKLIEWKEASNGQSALLVEGARRIGKSTIVEAFARHEYERYLIIDFAFATPEIHQLFDDVTDLSFLFLRLQLIYQVELIERRSLIVFDEVQFCPKARQAIKMLVKDGRYDYIETGSLIGIKRNVQDILIPSEEQRLHMYPMDFEEFCQATGDEATIPLLRTAFQGRKPLGEAVNRRLMQKFRLYMLVGGMPQAVKEYLATNNFQRVDSVKRSILQLYADDFQKIDPSGKASRLFAAVPAQLSENVSRFHVSSVLPQDRAGNLSELFFEMSQSQTVLISRLALDPAAGLAATQSDRAFKMYMSDTGLFVTAMFKDRDFTENILYEKLLRDKLSANLGYLYENVVAQILTANGYSLYYHAWPNKQTHRSYEIDFLLSRGNKVCPIEIKSSGYRTHASLDEFSRKYSERIAERYLIYTRDFARTDGLNQIPFYYAPFI